MMAARSLSKNFPKPLFCVLVSLVTLLNLAPIKSSLLADEVDATQEVAESAGQADLDEATVVKLRAKSEADWEAAIKLCESALEKGLDEDQQQYAKLLLTSTLYGRAARRADVIMNQPKMDRRISSYRKMALEDLEKVLKFDDKHGSAHLLIAKLQTLPEGDRDRARKAADKAVELLVDNQLEMSEAVLARAELAEHPEDQVRDIDKAIELNPRNTRALRLRAATYLKDNDAEGALKTFLTLLDVDPNDLISNQMIAQLLTQQEKFDEALEHLDQALESGAKSPQTLYLKAQILNLKGEKRKAIDAAVKASELARQNSEILLFLAGLRIESQDFDLAANDLKNALQLNLSDGGRRQAYFLRSIVEAERKDYDGAIRDIKRLLAETPENTPLQLQLAFYLERDQRPSKAIAVITEVIERETSNVNAYQRRGDLFLTMGRHAEAIEDYEAAMQIDPEQSGVLNNLAWVLATSPMDSLRDAKRSVQLATKACEVTEFKQAHIISTLAAGYAEDGNFEKAIEWSSKAVDMSKDEEQLANELASYKNNKPWREMNEVKEKPEPEEPVDADVDDLNFLDEPLEDDAIID